jgi:MtN3 and saliva related transmembrane protein
MPANEIIGVLASIFTAVSLLPQLIKMIREKKPDSVSPWMLAALFLGLGLWTAYGALKKDWIILISNGFSFLVNLLILILSLKYRNR